MDLKRRQLRNIGIGIGISFVAVFVGLTPAYATGGSSDEENPVDTTEETEKAEEKPENKKDAKEERKGFPLELDFSVGDCVITIRNQSSVHVGTNVEITVGDAVYVLEDVESAADIVTTSEVISVGEEGAQAFVVLGEDGISSLKAEDVACEVPELAPQPEPVVETPTVTG